jgi:hypothetical protein
MGQDTGSVEVYDQRDYDDRNQLAKLGKKEVLRVHAMQLFTESTRRERHS